MQVCNHATWFSKKMETATAESEYVWDLRENSTRNISVIRLNLLATKYSFLQLKMWRCKKLLVTDKELQQSLLQPLTAKQVASINATGVRLIWFVTSPTAHTLGAEVREYSSTYTEKTFK